MKKELIGAAIAAGLVLAPAVASAAPGRSSGAGGVTPGAAFYVDGATYRTVGTPTDLSGTGAPAHSFDAIYAIDGQLNVAEAAPGDRDYNGGRWKVYGVDVTDAMAAGPDGVFTSEEEVLAAVDDGKASLVATGVSFVCPVIPMPGR